MRIDHVGRFIAQDYGVDSWMGKRVAWFFSFSQDQLLVISQNTVLVKSDLRVYMQLASQNRRNAIDRLQATYYSPCRDDIFARIDLFGRQVTYRLSSLVNLPKSLFAGARTHQQIVTLSETFYAEKANR